MERLEAAIKTRLESYRSRIKAAHTSAKVLSDDKYGQILDADKAADRGLGEALSAVREEMAATQARVTVLQNCYQDLEAAAGLHDAPSHAEIVERIGELRGRASRVTALSLDNTRLEGDVSSLREALQKVEWSAYDETSGDARDDSLCPDCHARKVDERHDADCSIGRALSPGAAQTTTEKHDG
jgi:hypothetical protein